MESVVIMSFVQSYHKKKVFITGHTGFKGAWLTEWLLSLGAEVTGYSLQPPTTPSLFEQLALRGRIHHIEGDVRDAKNLRAAIHDARPDVVFHLAAQPLVRLSYDQPVETYATNVMGTVHLLDAIRLERRPCAVVVITTDKCYENKEWVHSYREEDPMGGHDPYSSSKGAAELVVSSYRRSYFSSPDSEISVASARAGNVVGGGDWALDRIVPDCIRSLQRGAAIPVRNKVATRPWQHVLEPLSGYLQLGAALMPGSQNKFSSEAYASSFNFGPNLASNRTVADLVKKILQHWPGEWQDQSNPNAVHEAEKLNLTTDKAFHLLDWQPRWDFETAIEKTVEWYRGVHEGAQPATLTQRHIKEYLS
jgi:CDP-glucose 4,6-dehydratase